MDIQFVFSALYPNFARKVATLIKLAQNHVTLRKKQKVISSGPKPFCNRRLVNA